MSNSKGGVSGNSRAKNEQKCCDCKCCARTIGGRFGGILKSLGAPELGAAIVKEAVKRAGIPGEEVDELIFGCGWQAGIGPNVARLAAVSGGLPVEVPAFTVNIPVLPV